jgi:hypothetical protein
MEVCVGDRRDEEFERFKRATSYPDLEQDKERQKRMESCKIRQFYIGSHRREWELRFTLAPSSIPERHYPKEFTITKKEETDE